MPTLRHLVPLNHTHEYTPRTYDASRFGHFEVDNDDYLPILDDKNNIVESEDSYFNNQQITKTVGEWYESWRPWQQTSLVCGMADRLSVYQLQALNTTLEPIQHRDYVNVSKHEYPSEPFKILPEKLDKIDRMEAQKQKKKRRRKKAHKRRAVNFSRSQTNSTLSFTSSTLSDERKNDFNENQHLNTLDECNSENVELDRSDDEVEEISRLTKYDELAESMVGDLLSSAFMSFQLGDVGTKSGSSSSDVLGKITIDGSKNKTSSASEGSGNSGKANCTSDMAGKIMDKKLYIVPEENENDCTNVVDSICGSTVSSDLKENDETVKGILKEQRNASPEQDDSSPEPEIDVIAAIEAYNQVFGMNLKREDNSVAGYAEDIAKNIIARTYAEKIANSIIASAIIILTTEIADCNNNKLIRNVSDSDFGESERKGKRNVDESAAVSIDSLGNFSTISTDGLEKVKRKMVADSQELTIVDTSQSETESVTTDLDSEKSPLMTEKSEKDMDVQKSSFSSLNDYADWLCSNAVKSAFKVVAESFTSTTKIAKRNVPNDVTKSENNQQDLQNNSSSKVPNDNIAQSELNNNQDVMQNNNVSNDVPNDGIEKSNTKVPKHVDTPIEKPRIRKTSKSKKEDKSADEIPRRKSSQTLRRNTVTVALINQFPTLNIVTKEDTPDMIYHRQYNNHYGAIASQPLRVVSPPAQHPIPVAEIIHQSKSPTQKLDGRLTRSLSPSHFSREPSAKTAEFFRSSSGLLSHGFNDSMMRRGHVHRPSYVEDIDLPLQKCYKSEKWYMQQVDKSAPKHTRLIRHYKTQLSRIWQWLGCWGEFEQTALLSSIVKQSDGTVLSALSMTTSCAGLPASIVLCELLQWLGCWGEFEQTALLSSIVKQSDGPVLSSLHDHILRRLSGIHFINHLTDDLLLRIMTYLPSHDLQTCALVCRRWYYLTNCQSLWKNKCLQMGLAGVGDMKIALMSQIRSGKVAIDWKVKYFEMTKLKKEIVRPAVKFGGHMVHPTKSPTFVTFKDDITDSDESGSEDDPVPYVDPDFWDKRPETTVSEKRRRRFKRKYTRLENVQTSMKEIPSQIVDEEDQEDQGSVKSSLKGVKDHITDSVDDAAYDIRPTLEQAKDILGAHQTSHSLKWVSKAVATGSHGAMAFAGDVSKVTRVSKLQGHLNGVLCLCFDSKRLISGSLDCTIRLWDVRSGRSLHKFYAHKGGVYCVALDSPTHTLVTGSWDTTIMVWDLYHFKRLTVLYNHRDCVTGVKITPKYIISSSYDRTIRVFLRESMNQVRLLSHHKYAVTCLDRVDDLVISGDASGKVMLANFETGECLMTFDGCDARVTSVTIQNNLVCAGDEVGKLYFWDKRNGHAEAAYNVHEASVNKLAVHRSRIYTASHDWTVREWDLATMTLIRSFDGHKGPVEDIQVDDRRLATCSNDGHVFLWNLEQPPEKVKAKVKVKKPKGVKLPPIK